MASSDVLTHAKTLFQEHGGTLNTSEAMRLGIHPSTLYAMRDAGAVERLSRGFYRLSELPPLSDPDLATVGLRVPQGVVCLISALYYHELTTEIPRHVDVALRRGSTHPRLESPPIRVYWFCDAAFAEGVEVHNIDGVPVRIYSREKTVADSFRYRAKLGLETPLEALRIYLTRRSADIDTLMRVAGVCRVGSVMRPYLEALL
jgi:predicted transcriptional regulator of viral defense system